MELEPRGTPQDLRGRARSESLVDRSRLNYPASLAIIEKSGM